MLALSALLRDLYYLGIFKERNSVLEFGSRDLHDSVYSLDILMRQLGKSFDIKAVGGGAIYE